MKRFLFFLILMFTVGLNANAQTIKSVSVMFTSYHVDRETGYNERNPGLEIRFGDDYIIGVYETSKSKLNGNPRRFTGYLGKAFEYEVIPYTHIGIGAGIASGYGYMWDKFGFGFNESRNPIVPFPFLIPNLQVGGRLSLVSHIIMGKQPTFGFQLKYKFN